MENSSSKSVNDGKVTELVITRVFDAPLSAVWKAWTESEEMAQWFGPKLFTSTVAELNAKPGGAIRLAMHGPDSGIYPMTGTFSEVIKPAKLVFTTQAVEDEAGNPQLETRDTATFAEMNGKTQLTLTVIVIKATPKAEPALSGMEQGWSESLDKLADYLKKPNT